MSELLTPQEALQALQNGKKVECLLDGLGTWQNVLLFPTGVLANANNKFRLAQEMITIGDVSFPKPVSEPPKRGSGYYMPAVGRDAFYIPVSWEDDLVDRFRLKRGLIHLSKENAIAHAKALIKLSGGTIDE